MGHKKQNIRRMQLIQSTKSEREKLDEMIKVRTNHHHHHHRH